MEKKNVLSAQMLGVSLFIRSRNGALSRKGCVVNGQMTKAKTTESAALSPFAPITRAYRGSTTDCKDQWIINTDPPSPPTTHAYLVSTAGCIAQRIINAELTPTLLSTQKIRLKLGS